MERKQFTKCSKSEATFTTVKQSKGNILILHKMIGECQLQRFGKKMVLRHKTKLIENSFKLLDVTGNKFLLSKHVKILYLNSFYSDVLNMNNIIAQYFLCGQMN